MAELNVGPLSPRTLLVNKGPSSGVSNVSLDADMQSILTEFNILFSYNICTVRNFLALVLFPRIKTVDGS